MRIILDVLRTTGITATAGIGPNLYLAKIAMDIYAKHVQPDEHGVRIAALDEMKYRQLMWTHRPLTDFWRVGQGYEKKLESVGLYTMGDIARCSLGAPTDLYNEDTLYGLFGVNAGCIVLADCMAASSSSSFNHVSTMAHFFAAMEFSRRMGRISL